MVDQVVTLDGMQAKARELAAGIRAAGDRIVDEAAARVAAPLPGETPRATGELAGAYVRRRTKTMAVIENRTAHAGWIVPGRRRGVTRAFLGSEQAPVDIVNKTIDATQGAVLDAIDQVWERLG